MYQLHCFSQSGNSYKVAFLLCALQQPWEAKFVDFMSGITRTPQWRDDLNEMGEAPVLDDRAKRITQSGAILTYLAQKHGAFNGKTEDERLDVLRWLLFDNHKFTSYFATYRFMKSFAATAPDPAVMTWLKGRMDSAFSIVNQHLASREFLVGDQPTIADMSLSGYLFYPIEESGYDVAALYPHIGTWLQRLQQIPGWANPYEIMPGGVIAPKW
ncbi:glutathione S-transferase C-terminal domain-containing protein [Curvibacter sp. CHRR-16]|uniref:glutathione S-transferase family protein n=1 Tax=Curvibacter sp. CHRR-16 TaxID=2835872 RepID=UPI001BD94873|nr:glutathione S-transferase [Curvibacter sp. CHRR-16]MBT0569811.1 glutathione S-transferase C-terminal domain-containing protein [Curvibacter sp. CHRR-16]